MQAGRRTSGLLPVSGRMLWHRWCALALRSVACLLAFTCPRCGNAQVVSFEDAIKATYLYKFLPFIEWSNLATEFQGGAVTLCVIGSNAIVNFLASEVTGQQVAGHPINVRYFADVTGNPGCAMMYVTGSDAQRIASVLAAVRGTPVLTVTDDSLAPAAKGIINFVRSGDKVRFEIDSDAAVRNGLRVSSKLLSLATRVTSVR